MDRIYDMHIHMWSGGDPDGLIERFNTAGVYGGAVFSEPPPEMKMGHTAAGEQRMDQVLSFCEKYGERLFPVFWIHPDEKGALSLVKRAADKGIRGFKIICNSYYVYESKSMELIHCIAQAGLPICFHSGILWTPGVSGDFNRPLNWERLIEVPKLRFSMAHCSWPWYDECLALYGKFLYLSGREDFSCEMYLDLTPGTPPSYRRDLLTKLLTTGYDIENHIMFGVDTDAANYSVEWAQKWMKLDNEIYDELGIGKETREKIYALNMLRFFGISGEKHRYMPKTYDDS
ncbi:MAG: amidohydrolase family protein [Treponema sp.]|nr:amidohydrolase family protein [Treponema sp.]